MQLPHPRALFDRLLIGSLGIGLLALLTWTDATWRADMWFYDVLQTGARPAIDDRVVLVLVDDRSLAALGRWPWSRTVHAQLLDRLQDAAPHGIAFDVMFAEPDHDAAADAALADAIARNGRVALPVMADIGQPGGLLIEVMALPALGDAAAVMGHAEIELDRDGVARRAALYAGLGSPHWPALALALRDLDPASRTGAPPGMQTDTRDETDASPYRWHRSQRVLIPYAPPDAFATVSYVDVLDGTVPAALLRGRWLIVGAEAAGLGQRVVTPVATRGGGQSAVTYHANLLNTLLQGSAIVPLTRWQQLLAGAVLVLVPVGLSRDRRRGRSVWYMATLAIVLAMLTSLVLWHAGRWFGPGATVATLLGGMATLMPLRLRKSQRLASSDGLTGLANRTMFDTSLARENASARRTGRPLSLLLVDVDHFKHYNDSQGHQAGDAVLRRIATALLASARRPRDLAARYGGDELVLILPETPRQAASAIADALGEDVRTLAIAHPGSDTAPIVTLSIGIATFDPLHDPPELDLLERADAALYRAKHAGRNRSAWPPAGVD